MDDIKDTPEAGVAFAILNFIGLAASQIEDLVVTIFGTKGTVVMTNVPGPREKLYLAGAPVSTIMGWVPQSGHLGMGVSILSYAGQVRVGIATDGRLVPDPERIVALFHEEFAALQALARAQAATHGIRPLLSALDAALAALDELQATRTAIPEPETAIMIEEAPAAPLPDTAEWEFFRLSAASRLIAPEADRAPGNLEPPAAPILPPACQALTRAGTRCKNMALPGSSFCRVHQPGAGQAAH
jgi:hypothetical protein